MNGVHPIELGQWPPALVLFSQKRAYQSFMRKKCGGKASAHPPFPIDGAGHSQKLVNGAACYFLISVGKHECRDELACTLAHEATHVMRWLLEYVGEHEPGTETQSYLVEHIVRLGLKALA